MHLQKHIGNLVIPKRLKLIGLDIYRYVATHEYKIFGRYRKFTRAWVSGIAMPLHSTLNKPKMCTRHTNQYLLVW